MLTLDNKGYSNAGHWETPPGWRLGVPNGSQGAAISSNNYSNLKPTAKRSLCAVREAVSETTRMVGYYGWDDGGPWEVT